MQGPSLYCLLRKKKKKEKKCGTYLYFEPCLLFCFFTEMVEK